MFLQRLVTGLNKDLDRKGCARFGVDRICGNTVWNYLAGRFVLFFGGLMTKR